MPNRLTTEILGCHTTSVNSVAFSHGGAFVATASLDGTARIWDGQSGKSCTYLECLTVQYERYRVQSDDAFVATANGDNTVSLWRVNDGALIKKFTGHVQPVERVAFAPDGTMATSSRTYGRLWNVATGSAVYTLTAHTIGSLVWRSMRPVSAL